MYYENAKNGLSCCIDWISFTVFDLSIGEVLEFLGFDIYDLEAKYGARGYKHSLTVSEVGFVILYDGEKNQGIHVDIPSKALGMVLEKIQFKNSIHTPFGIAFDMDINIIKELIEYVLKYGHFTRFDIAVDDTIGFYTVSEVWEYLTNDRYVATFRKYEHYDSRLIGNERNGETVYMGSRQSNFFMRVYDKQLEQKVDYNWVRWELEIKNECADILAQHLLNKSMNEVIFGTLSNFIRFINEDNVRKCRCSTSEKWNEFLNNVKEMEYKLKRHVTTLDDKEEWIERQVMPSICALMLAEGGSLGFIEEKILKGVYRMSEDLIKRVAAINPHWQELLYYLE